MARLDRLGPAKEVAQIGAAIGREFSHALLAAVMHKPEGELGSSQNFVLLRSHPRMIAVAEIRRPGARAAFSFTLKSIQQMMGRKPRSRSASNHYGAVLIVVNLMNTIGFLAMLFDQEHAVVPGYWRWSPSFAELILM